MKFRKKPVGEYAGIDIEEGKVSKGGVNSRPTTPRPPPPKGQGSRIVSGSLAIVAVILAVCSCALSATVYDAAKLAPVTGVIPTNCVVGLYPGIIYPDLVLTERLFGTPTTRTLNEIFDATRSCGYTSGGSLSPNDPADGMIHVAAGTGYIRTTDSITGKLLSFDWAEVEDFELIDGAMNIIFAEYENEAITLKTTASFTTINGTTQVPVGVCYRRGDEVEIADSGGAGAYLPNFRFKEWERLQYKGVERVSGGRLSETGVRYIRVTDAVYYLNFSKSVVTSVDTSGADTFTMVYRDGGIGWTYVTGQTQFSNSLYDSNTGTPEDVGVAKYAVYWVYQCLDSGVYVQLGQVGDSKLADAQSCQPPTPPDYLASWATLLGKIFILNGAANATEIQNTIDVSFSSTTLSDHNALTGLDGGLPEERYHITADEHIVVQATSGENTGDQDLSGYLTEIPGAIEVDSVGLRYANGVDASVVVVTGAGLPGVNGSYQMYDYEEGAYAVYLHSGEDYELYENIQDNTAYITDLGNFQITYLTVSGGISGEWMVAPPYGTAPAPTSVVHPPLVLVKPIVKADTDNWDQLVSAAALAVADGTYTVGIGTTQNGTITVKDGIITAITEAVD